MTNTNLFTPGWPQSIVEIDAAARAQNMPEREIKRLWETHDLLAKLFSGQYRGSGRPFINHLSGTAGLALVHAGDSSEILASYAHAAYTQGDFGRLTTGASPANRKTLRAVIGEAAEALVFNYDDFDWITLLEQYSLGEELFVSDSGRRLLFIKILNELDDSMDCGVYDTNWCEQCLHRLELGASVVDELGRHSVAKKTRSHARFLRTSGLVEAPGIRRKQSVTIINPKFAPRQLLKFGRKVLNVTSRIKTRLHF